LVKLAPTNGLILLGYQVIRSLKGHHMNPAVNILTYAVNEAGDGYSNKRILVI
jgi:hypothetical protein